MSKDERFPIMMSMFSRNQQHLDVPMVWVLNHEKQCLSNHMQTPQRLKERGGLSPKELYAVLHDMRWDDVKFSENQCLEIIKNMVLTCTLFVEFFTHLVHDNCGGVVKISLLNIRQISKGVTIENVRTNSLNRREIIVATTLSDAVQFFQVFVECVCFRMCRVPDGTKANQDDSARYVGQQNQAPL